MKDYNLINQRATTCRHGGHCEWVACDKCNHYEPDVLNQQPCSDCISRQEALNVVHRYFEHYLQLNDDICLDGLRSLPSVTPKEKTRKGEWLRMSDLSEQEDDRYKCSRCGNVVHYRDKMNLYTFNSWCGRCGSNNGRRMEVSE